VPARKIPVACVQARAADRYDFQTHWPRILALTEEAARDGARLVVLPEGTVPGYVLGEDPIAPSELEGAARDFARVASAHGATIVYGGARVVDGRTYNGANVIGPDGSDLGYAAKQFLWHFDRRWFGAGTTLDPVDTPLGRLGLLVCADGRIPTIARTLVERGAEILVMPTAWVTSGRDPAALENVQADLMANVRARENGVPFVAANKCGVELQSVAYCGKSAIVAADGAFVARAPQDGECVISGEIEIGGPSRTYPSALSVDDETRRRMRSVGSSMPPQRLRIAFTAVGAAADVTRFARLAVQSDADVFVARGKPAEHIEDIALVALSSIEADSAKVVRTAGASLGVVGEGVLENPHGLVAARLDGIDLFVALVEDANAPETVALARTRAAELRAYLIVCSRDGVRAFAVDPDGAVVAGTYDDYRLAGFGYDRARATTTVAPHTDVLRGLGVAAEIRARSRRKDPAPVA
jgi:predicted amidohydrolase